MSYLVNYSNYFGSWGNAEIVPRSATTEACIFMKKNVPNFVHTCFKSYYAVCLSFRVDLRILVKFGGNAFFLPLAKSASLALKKDRLLEFS